MSVLKAINNGFVVGVKDIKNYDFDLKNPMVVGGRGNDYWRNKKYIYIIQSTHTGAGGIIKWGKKIAIKNG